MSSSSSALPPPSPPAVSSRLPTHSRNVSRDTNATDDTASQKSISLSSPPASPRMSLMSDPDPRQSFATSRSSGSYSYRRSSTAFGGLEDDEPAFYNRTENVSASTNSQSVYSEEPTTTALPTYPPPRIQDDTASIASFASTSSKKARPESLLMTLPEGQLVLGVALVDFNHLVGPRIEYFQGEVFEDEEVTKILPFLALPDGAHMSAEDYSYFHIVKPGPLPTTIFGISCNQQIAAADLLVKGEDVTRSTVQKAVVVLASKPVFGPIREKLRVVTTALFAQRDFSDYSILEAFASTLELSLRGQLTESGLYMGTSLRELVHTFRQRTLVLVKALILQKRIMFYGYPVERLCTFQYSLVSLLPGLLQNLDDCGSPPLATRAPTLEKATSLKTSDHKSMLAFMGLPLDVFGKDAFFQPYLPLQQLDMIHNTPSWLCGCTNSIITQQKEIDLLVNTDTGIFEFRDPKLERSAGLTAADRKWMDEIIQDVNEGWGEDDPSNPRGMKFKGSDDYLRSKFEEYISAALSTVKFQDFTARGENGGVLITGGAGGDSNAVEDFNPLWISEFKKTNAYEVWDRVTDPLVFDIIEPRHPCNEKPSVVADIGLRLQEGIQELKLDQQLAPAREAVARTLATGSTNFFKAVEGVRGRWAQRSASGSEFPNTGANNAGSSRASTPPVEVSKADLEGEGTEPKTATQASFRPFSISSRISALTSPGASSSSSTQPSSVPPSASSESSRNSGSAQGNAAGAALSSWGANIGSFLSTTKLPFGRQQNSESGSTSPPLPQQALSAPPVPARATTESGSTTTWGNLSALVSPPAMPRFNSLGAGGAGAGGTGLGAALAAKASSTDLKAQALGEGKENGKAEHA
ncbi:transport protein Avl9-domain-containing protein [Ephemerocybe angulata]|uniref:Transport protein Avl9-domain-containing protein n=1 Tax=Ephemerocybe angulata TaxID=980116 RepID=A0A8H6HJC9_9AGAR|nr:transport protein Avl9-domain-containing protein [Tulosesus angulatus]